MSTIDPNDPRLTAYALGALTERESAEVAALIAQSPEAARTVAEIQSLAGKLAAAFESESELAIATDTVRLLSHTPDAQTSQPARRSPRYRQLRALALAASVALIATAVVFVARNAQRNDAATGTGISALANRSQPASAPFAKQKEYGPPPTAECTLGKNPFDGKSREALDSLAYAGANPAQSAAPSAATPASESARESEQWSFTSDKLIQPALATVENPVGPANQDSQPLAAPPAAAPPPVALQSLGYLSAAPASAEPAASAQQDHVRSDANNSATITLLQSQITELRAKQAALVAASGPAEGDRFRFPARERRDASADPLTEAERTVRENQGLTDQLATLVSIYSDDDTPLTVEDVADAEQDPRVQALDAQAAELAQEMSAVAAQHGEQHREYQELAARYDETQNQLTAARKARVSDLRRRKLEQIEQAYQNSLARLDASKSELERMRTRAAEQNAARAEAARVAAEIARLERERQRLSNEAYDAIVDNPFVPVANNPLSTFAIDVDTASYSNMRRFLNRGELPPPSAIRLEELINYFTYDAAPADADRPFAVNVEVADCPWTPGHRLAKVSIKGYEIPVDERPASNLVFLIDVSGSMGAANKLPLVRQSLHELVEQLGIHDRVGIVTYAGESGVALRSTPCDDRTADILAAIDQLRSGGSTNGAAGIEVAYHMAEANFIAGGVNRVILATDGDFNVGITARDALEQLIIEKAQTGVFLSVLGYGMGNLKDATLERLADRGNGHYAYIDTLAEARKVLVEQLSGTLVTIAKDVKIQVEFNPTIAGAYRLLGYENRLLAARDFNDDAKDAGEVGAGHSVTALYEIIPADMAGADGLTRPTVDPLKYQHDARVATGSDELMTVKLRYKPFDGDVSRLIEVPVRDEGRALAQASPDFHFAAAVASFGMLLRASPYAGDYTFADALALAEAGTRSSDAHRAEFLDLIRSAQRIAANQ